MSGMSGDNYTINCPKCHTSQPVFGRAMTLAMTCSSCGVYFRTGKWSNLVSTFNATKGGKPQSTPALAIGSRGKIDGTLYRVMGFVVKQEAQYHFLWREYLLFNPYKGYAFLSESGGSWNIIWPIEENLSNSRTDRQIYVGIDRFDLYSRSRARVVYAQGEFFFDVLDTTGSTETYEYIAPPELIGVEESDDSRLWFRGEYISPKEVAEAFQVSVDTLPSKKGMGYTEPLQNRALAAVLIPVTIALLVIVSAFQYVWHEKAENKIVYQGVLNTGALKDQKVFVTTPFTLSEGKRNVSMNLFCRLENDWFFGEFSLINETTGEEFNFTKDIEYYSGYESEYGSWVEGSQHGDAFLSSIPGGTYHMNIYPDLSSGKDHQVTITVRRDVAFMGNFWLTVVGILAFPTIFYIRRYNSERRRWEDSDYSPYGSYE